MFDLLIKNGQIVYPTETIKADLAIKNGLIVAVASPGTLPDQGRRVVDAAGKYVMPGGVDAHVHFNFGFPPVVTQLYEQGSTACAYGGTTTCIDFAFQTNGGSPVAAVEAKLGEMEGRMAVDYALHCLLTGKLNKAIVSELKQVIDLGVPSIKLMMIYFDWWGGDGGLYATFKETGKHGGLGMVHAENEFLWDYLSQELIKEGKTDGRWVEESRPSIAEEEAIRRAIFFAEKAKSALYVLHTTSKEGLSAIKEARAKGHAVYCETCHNYLCFTNEDVKKRPNGLRFNNYPPLRYAEDRETLWREADRGGVSVVATDDFSADAEKRDQMTQVLPNPEAGHNGLETRMAVTFSEGVAKNRISLNRFVELTATNPARLFGLYPKKGILSVGSDGDVVIFDPNQKRTFKVEELHTVDFSIWDGFEVTGLPVMSVLRGRVVMENGEFTGETGYGQFVPGKIDPKLLLKPGL